MKRAKKVIHIICGVLVVLCVLAAAAGLLYQLWAGFLAEPGHAFESGYLGMAITWTGIILACVFGAAWTGTIEW